MSALFRRIRFAAWPIWAKLLAGFLLAVVIPLVLVLGLVFSTVQQVGSQNIQLFVQETGARQARTMTAVFDQARVDLNDFVNNDANQVRLRTVMPLPGQQSTADRTDEFTLGVAILNQLLIRTNAYYDQVSLVDLEGTLVLRAQQSGVVGGGADLSETAAYRQATETLLRGETQALSLDVTRTNQPVIEVVKVISFSVSGHRESVPVGFLIGRLNLETLLADNLAISSNFLRATSGLVTRSGLVVSASDATVSSELASDTLLQQAATSGQARTQVITRDDTEYLRYYAPITDTPFVLVVEGATNILANQVTEFLAERGFALVLGILFLVAVLVMLVNQVMTPPLRRIGHAIQAMGRGNYDLPLPDIQRGDEIGQLAGSLADTRKRVLDLVTELELRIENRARDMSATREISHAAATQRDLQQLMDQVVNLIVERFSNIYHAQVFLVDSENRYAILRASTGEPGRQLLARGHRLGVGSVSVVGRATETGDMVVARDTATSGVHRRNELLPDTLAELAIALRVGDRVIGALDVQSRQSDAFNQEQMEVLQTMADQVAVAIENARLYAESLRRLQELEINRRASTLEAWHQYVDSLRASRLESIAGIVTDAPVNEALRQAVLAEGQVVVGDVTERQTVPIAVPIRLRGQLLGTVEWEVPHLEFDQNKVQLAQDLTDRLAVNLENARLFQESQRVATRERLVNEISAQLTTQNEIDQILQTAVREVGRAVRAPHVSIRLNPQTETNGHHQNGHNGQNGHSNGQGE